MTMPYKDKAAHAAHQRAYRERRRLAGDPIRKTPENQRRYELRSRYGLTPEEYDAMLAAQGGVCRICHGTDGKALAVDHNHTTGQVRGLLCQRCNRGLGLFRDDPALLVAATEYLKA